MANNTLQSSDSGRLLIIGKTGQLARAIASLDPRAKTLGRETLDLAQSEDAIEAALLPHLTDEISGVILAAAYTQVDAAEKDLETAMAANGVAPGVIARLCRGKALPLVHISTDYVFNGEGAAPYAPDDACEPLNAYGKSKRAGEIAVEEIGGAFAILRTSWIYDGTGKNFMTTMLKLSETRDELSVVHDQIGRPTFAGDLAEAAILAVRDLAENSDDSGIYHVTNSGDPISWADFARAIFAMSGKDMTVHNIPSADYPTPAKRPAFSVMDLSDFETAFETTLPTWQDGLSRAFEQWRASSGEAKGQTE